MIHLAREYKMIAGIHAFGMRCTRNPHTRGRIVTGAEFAVTSETTCKRCKAIYEKEQKRNDKAN